MTSTTVRPPRYCEVLDWDSKFFGRTIAMVVQATLSSDQAETVRAWAMKERIHTVYFLVNPSSQGSVRAAESVGFHLVDVKMSYQQALPFKSIEPDLTRPATPEDLPALEQIAGTEFQTGRFANDPNFGPQEATRLYKEWVRNSVGGWAQYVLVVEHKERVAGFVTCHRVGTRGKIGLIAVDSAATRQGLGVALVSAALRWFTSAGAESVEVVTQSTNRAAQKLYVRTGFALESVDLWYHLSPLATQTSGPI